MRKVILLLIMSFTSVVFSINEISSLEIIKRLNNQENIKLENLTVIGELDFTIVVVNVEKNNSISNFFTNLFSNNSSTIIYKHKIKNQIEFVNCKFQDEIFGTRIFDELNENHQVVFENFVKFENCTFENRFYFKYSEFEDNAEFNNCTFEDEINFKYVEFSKNVKMRNIVFGDDANFKYTEFDNGVDFSNSQFKREANFKYTEIGNPFIFNDTKFGSNKNFKYAEIDNKKAKKLLKR